MLPLPNLSNLSKNQIVNENNPKNQNYYLTEDYFYFYGKKFELVNNNEVFKNITLKLKVLLRPQDIIDHYYEVLKSLPPNVSQDFWKEFDNFSPYFAVVWPAARELTHFILTNFSHPQTKSNVIHTSEILEIGCGLGLPSLLLAKMGFRVVATDFHPLVFEFLNFNRKLNDISEEKLNLELLDWQKTDAPEKNTEQKKEQNKEEVIQKNNFKKYDVIVGSDILYEPRHAEIVAQFIDEHLNSKGQCFISDPGRDFLQNFVDLMLKKNFSLSLSGDQYFVLHLKKNS
jgi:predicted nicotinamide N-methyase